MAYTDSKIQAINEAVASADVGTFAASAVVLCRVNQPCDLFAVGAKILVTLDTSAMIITVTRRLIPGTGGDATATAVAVVTIPTLTPLGKIVWKNCHSTVATVVVVAPVKLNAGDELVFTANSGGGSGMWRPWFEAYPRPEVKANNGNFLQSA